VTRTLGAARGITFTNVKQKLNYLTVQDLIWINTQVSGKVTEFQFDLLEDASYFQYGYGKSTDLIGQAARFFQGFHDKKPFTEGNAATAFVGLVSFLEMNGYHLKPSDSTAKAKVGELLGADLETTTASLKAMTTAAHDDHHAAKKDIVLGVLGSFPKTIASLHQAGTAPV
jgi:prophage maintenance system killer protein